MPGPAPLDLGSYYHVYNRGNNSEDIFVEERNYAFFLKLYAHHVSPVADTFAYCLMRNHFHLLVRVKEKRDLTGLSDLSGLPSQRFSNLFNAYTKAFNKTYGRTGALFQRPFSRIEVTSDAYFARLVVYIHRNPRKHGFVDDFRDWPHSSYRTLLSTKPTRLQRDEVLTWFGGAPGLVAMHEEETVDPELLDLAADDL